MFKCVRNKIKHKLREWRCRLFHKHSIEKTYYPGFLPNVVVLSGCEKCDLWQNISDPDSYIKKNN